MRQLNVTLGTASSRRNLGSRMVEWMLARKARMAASRQRFSISAPEYPLVLDASSSRKVSKASPVATVSGRGSLLSLRAKISNRIREGK